MNNPTIVITGLGAVTPFGSGVDALWQALLRGESAISDMDLFDLGGLACTRAGVIRHVTPLQGFEGVPRASQFAAIACREALAQAGLLESPERADIALITASNFGDLDCGEQALIPFGASGFSPAAAKDCAQSVPADRLARLFGLGGLRLPLSLSCSSGASAVATAANLISIGRAHRVLVVGYDALSRFSWSGLCSLRTMAKEEVRPFDLNRSGTIFSEGAAALLLETSDRCEARKIPPLAILTGWATGNNGFHMTAPAPRGAGSARVMREALRRASLEAAAIDHINAHGTGTKPNDMTETQALQDLFGARAATIPVTSIKGLLGHLLGAAGAVEIVVSILSLQNDLIPPTGHYETPDPECALDVVASPRACSLTHVLSNSAGFGGCNAAVILSHPSRAGRASHEMLRKTDATHPVITALGAICALGSDTREIALAYAEGESALAPLSRFALSEAVRQPLTGEAPEVDPATCGVATKSYLDRASRLFLASCGMAFQQAGLTAAFMAERGFGIFAGTTWGCLDTAELFFADYILKGPRLVKPVLFPHAYTNTPVSLAAMEWSLTGPHENFVSATTASGAAFIEAADQISSGHASAIVVAGVDVLSATRLRSAAATPQGEAAVALVLEDRITATARGATILAEVLGCGLATDPDTAIAAALIEAGLLTSDIQAVYTNDGTLVGDFSAVRIHQPQMLCGDVQGATTLLHTALAMLGKSAAPVLIITRQETVTLVICITCA